MVIYQVIEEILEISEIGSYTAFGICAYQKAGDDPKQLSHVPEDVYKRQTADRCQEPGTGGQAVADRR